MRARLWAPPLVGLLLTAACGGLVVVEPDGAGGGTSGVGAGGATAWACDFACGGPIGLCGCTGPCTDGETRGVACGESGVGASCTCSVEGQVVGSCDEPDLVCVLPGSCCAAVFGP